MRILTLSGWGQPPQAMTALFPQAEPFDYAHLRGWEICLEALRCRQADIVVGWSLGGQIAARAVAEGALRPELLVLIGAPFQFLWRPQAPLGMKPDLFKKFHDNYCRNPARTLDKSWALVAHGDERAQQVSARLAPLRRHVREEDWGYWLDALAEFSCHGLNFSFFPNTLLLHGARDAVSGPAQSHAFLRAIPRARLDLWRGSGHAPHLHDTARAREAILHLADERRRAA